VRTNLIQFARFGFCRPIKWPPRRRISVHDSLEAACRPATFVVEAIREDLAVKQALFEEIEAYVATKTILASNSSSFPISQSRCPAQTPAASVVTHWFNPRILYPPSKSSLTATSEEVTQNRAGTAPNIGKLAIVLRRELRRFLVNRVQGRCDARGWTFWPRRRVREDITWHPGSMGFRLAALGPLQIHDSGTRHPGAVYRNLCPEICSDGVAGVVGKAVAEGHFGFKRGKFLFLPGRPADLSLPSAMNATWPCSSFSMRIEPAGQSFVARIGEPSGNRRVFRSAAVSTGGFQTGGLRRSARRFEMRFRRNREKYADGRRSQIIITCASPGRSIRRRCPPSSVTPDEIAAGRLARESGSRDRSSACPVATTAGRRRIRSLSQVFAGNQGRGRCRDQHHDRGAATMPVESACNPPEAQARGRLAEHGSMNFAFTK